MRILLADDHLVVRMGLRSLLEVQPDMTVVTDVATGEEALRAYLAHQPDLALMDLRMPGMDGIEATLAIRQIFPAARVVVLTTYETEEDICRALEAGAAAYLLKNTDGETLLQTLRAVHAGTYRLPESISTRLMQRRTAPHLSPRELEVLQWIARGLSNKEIAATLGVAENTVKNHVKMILDKLGVADRTQAVTTALQRGLIRLTGVQ